MFVFALGNFARIAYSDEINGNERHSPETCNHHDWLCLHRFWGPCVFVWQRRLKAVIVMT